MKRKITNLEAAWLSIGDGSKVSVHLERHHAKALIEEHSRLISDNHYVIYDRGNLDGILDGMRSAVDSNEVSNLTIDIEGIKELVNHFESQYYLISYQNHLLSELKNRVINEEMREKLANLSHQIWAHWMTYLFSRCEIEDLGKVIMWEDARRWKRQIETSYSDLTEREKDSDRKQADKIIEVLQWVQNG